MNLGTLELDFFQVLKQIADYKKYIFFIVVWFIFIVFLNKSFPKVDTFALLISSRVYLR